MDLQNRITELEAENEKLKNRLEEKTEQLEEFEAHLTKLINVTKLIAEGHYFNYTPSVSGSMHAIEDLAANFNSMIKSIKKYQEHLESMVKERTIELEKTLKEVQGLKIQQDGDYYLTSLLINPLSSNRTESDNVKVEFFIKQKKKFQFRNWYSSIGGDMCCAHNISLQGRTYTCFLNSDAMGKSIQGAGGALVLGAVFEAIIQRTKSDPERQKIDTIKWVKDTFIELHKVFESFDGSMMVSLIVGLADEETGKMCWINAEHPHMVLYRDGKASFIEEGTVYRKIGMPLAKNLKWHSIRKDKPLEVFEFQLQEGDVVIAGSDGRDDLVIGLDDKGERIINEDENLFLRKVEEARADLHEIYTVLLESGGLTDDLSLLRLGYREKRSNGVEEVKEASELLKRSRKVYQKGDADNALKNLKTLLKEHGENREALRDATVIYFSQKQFARAQAFGQRFLEIDPENEEILFLTTCSLMKMGKINDAAEVGERLIRHAHTAVYLMHLAKVYLKIENFTRAGSLVAEALKLEPDNEKARTLRDLIRQQKAG